MFEIFTKQSIGEFFKFFVIYFIEISVLFLVVSFLVFIISEKFREKLTKHLLKTRFSSFIKAFMVGSITPFCSCSTIPLLNGFLKTGVSLGVSSVFLISSPLVNPVILTLFFISFGFKFTAIYFIVVFISALIFGVVISKIDQKMFLKDEFIKPKFILASSASSIVFKPASKALNCACNQTNANNIYKRAFLNSVSEYKKLFLYIFIAMMIGAAIHGFVPEVLISSYLGSSDTNSIFISAIFGILLYVRVEGLIPIGIVFLSSGVNAAAFGAFVITAAGVSLPELILLNRFFKLKFMVIFIGFMFCLAMLFGICLSANIV
ncbi:permease [Campylobacter suis]|uniref:Two-component membrane permease complex subunit SMU_747c n=1 Tax=Campylobacter suis TaxID=2790657 RepID=A0ABM8Q1X6_9BACT|nr:permease [Campylobacter suis]CAD7286847.1 Putative two-component membrane permease complex subunit SMU_747c [Campylobacter suis]